MNKKVIAMAVTAALAAPMMAQAADISFNGDARYRWGDIKTDVPDASNSVYDNRVRVVVTGKTDDGVSATARLSNDVTGASGATASASAVTTDYAYITAPLMGGMATLDIGDQLATWGAGFAIKDDFKTGRVKLTVPVGDWSISGAYDPDNVAGSAAVVGKVAGWKLGLLSAGKVTDIFAMGKAGPVGLTAENFTNGDSTATGTLLMGQYPIGGMNLNFGYASTANGFVAHKKFTPISTIGKDQKTGILNLGEMGDTTAMLVGVDAKAGPGQVVAMFGTGTVKGMADYALTMLDLKYVIPMGKDATFDVTYGTVASDVAVTEAGGTKAWTAMGANLNVKF